MTMKKEEAAQQQKSIIHLFDFGSRVVGYYKSQQR